MSVERRRRRCLVAFDFDHTLIDANSDTRVRDLTPDPLPEHIERLYSEKGGWTRYMAAIFLHLHQRGKRPDELLACVRALPLVAGMRDLLLYLERALCDVIIVSDANTVFIECLLKEVGLASVIQRVFTNPASFDPDGRLTLQAYHQQDWCEESTPNLCKGHILDEHVAEQKVAGREYDFVAFVGDGLNDLCPCLRLDTSDFVFARRGYRLTDAVRKAGNRVRAKVVVWETGFDIMDALKKELEPV